MNRYHYAILFTLVSFLMIPQICFAEDQYKSWSWDEKEVSETKTLWWVFEQITKMYDPGIILFARKTEKTIRKHTSASGEVSFLNKEKIEEPSFRWETELNTYGIDKFGFKCGLEKPFSLIEGSTLNLKGESIQSLSGEKSESRIVLGLSFKW